MCLARKLIAIVGPTASGKTDLALRLAPEFGGEIVNADSRQIYRGMDIGTAKPTPAQREAVPHHLFDIVNPDEPFSLAQYHELAHAALNAIWERGRVPFLVGGTGQYVWALLEGWQVPRVPPQPALRAELEERAQREGTEALYRELQALDPVAAARIHPRNRRRIIRALEVIARTGRPFSAQQTKAPPAHATLILGLNWSRAELRQRIEKRIQTMLEAGFIEEVRRLLAAGYRPELPSMSSLGYREIAAYLEGRLTLEEAIDRFLAASNRLLRMQATWFRQDDPRIHWLDTHDDPVAQARTLIAAFLSCHSPPPLTERGASAILRLDCDVGRDEQR